MRGAATQWQRRSFDAVGLLMFSTWSGKPISPNRVLRRWVFQPAKNSTGRTQLGGRSVGPTHRAHDKGVPAKVVAWLMGHTNADVTINVSTQVLDASLRTAVDRIGR